MHDPLILVITEFDFIARKKTFKRLYRALDYLVWMYGESKDRAKEDKKLKAEKYKEAKRILDKAKADSDKRKITQTEYNRAYNAYIDARMEKKEAIARIDRLNAFGGKSNIIAENSKILNLYGEAKENYKKIFNME